MVFYCDLCSVRELTLVPNHRPPNTQSFNPDYHLMGQRCWGGKWCRLLRQRSSEDITSWAWMDNHISQNNVLCNYLFMPPPPPPPPNYMATWRHISTDTHDAIVTSLLRKNDVTASFRRYNDVVITSRVRYDTALWVRYIWGPKLQRCHWM